MLASGTFLRAAAIGAALAGFAAVAPAKADCQEDIGGFMKKRDAVIAQLNALSGSGGKKKQLDPVAACPKFKALSGILGETVAYMEKNKDWCNIPDQLLEGARASAASSPRRPARPAASPPRSSRRRSRRPKAAR